AGVQVAFLEMGRSAKPAAAKPDGTSTEAVAQWIRQLGGKVEVERSAIRSISLAGTGAGDAYLAHLANLTQLRKLDLSATEVGDVGLRHLKNLTSLEDLNLSQTTVSDTGVTSLKVLPALRSLTLDGTLVRGASF